MFDYEEVPWGAGTKKGWVTRSINCDEEAGLFLMRQLARLVPRTKYEICDMSGRYTKFIYKYGSNLYNATTFIGSESRDFNWSNAKIEYDVEYAGKVKLCLGMTRALY